MTDTFKDFDLVQQYGDDYPSTKVFRSSKARKVGAVVDGIKGVGSTLYLVDIYSVDPIPAVVTAVHGLGFVVDVPKGVHPDFDGQSFVTFGDMATCASFDKKQAQDYLCALYDSKDGDTRSFSFV